MEHGAVLDRLLTESVAALMEAGVVDIERVAQDGVRVRAGAGASSFRREETLQRNRYVPLPDDSTPVAEWRVRMGTEAAKVIYRERAATAECVNACARNRGLQRLLVRGLKKVKAVVTWFALAHNMMRTLGLRIASAMATRPGADLAVLLATDEFTGSTPCKNTPPRQENRRSIAKNRPRSLHTIANQNF